MSEKNKKPVEENLKIGCGAKFERRGFCWRRAMCKRKRKRDTDE